MLNYSVTSLEGSFKHFKEGFDKYATELDVKMEAQKAEIERYKNAYVQTTLVLNYGDSTERTNYETMYETFTFNFPIEIQIEPFDKTTSHLKIEVPNNHYNLRALKQSNGNFDEAKKRELIYRVFDTISQSKWKSNRETTIIRDGVRFDFQSDYCYEIKTNVAYEAFGETTVTHYLQEQIDDEQKAFLAKEKANYHQLKATQKGNEYECVIQNPTRFSTPILGIENAAILYEDNGKQYTGTVFLPFVYLLSDYNDFCTVRLDGTDFWEGEEYIDIRLKDFTFVDPSVKPILQQRKQ